MYSLLLAALLNVTPIKVYIVDTGLSKINEKQFSPHIKEYDKVNKFSEMASHGPAMTGLVLDGVCPRVEVYMCNYFTKGYMKCLDDALDNQYDYMLLSLSGFPVVDGEKELLTKISITTKIVVASGNDGVDIKKTKVLPASLMYEGIKNFYVVSNISETSNYGEGTIKIDGTNKVVYNYNGDKMIMSGSSVSAARYLNFLLKQVCYENW